METNNEVDCVSNLMELMLNLVEQREQQTCLKRKLNSNADSSEVNPTELSSFLSNFKDTDEPGAQKKRKKYQDVIDISTVFLS